MDKKEKIKEKSSFFDKFLNSVEVVGNKLPHPITLFALLAFLIIILSALFKILGVSATGEIMNSKTLELEQKTVNTISLLSGEGISYMIKNAITNFTSFAPLGIVLVTMLGVGCAEGSGYIEANMKKMVSKTPAKLITPVVVFLGVLSNVASDVGYVVLVPIGAIVFMAYKRHPLAGLAAAFAGVSGGFSANLLIGTVDTLLAGISTESAQILDVSYEVGATANWFFMFVSTFLIIILGTFITDKIVEPRLGTFDITDESVAKATELSQKEHKALKYANITLILYILFIILWAFPKNSLLRNPETGSLISKALLIDGIIIFIALGFFIPSIVYGKIAGTYKSEKDIGEQLSKNMSAMGSYIALTFVVAQFVNYFNYTNIGTILALKGADFLVDGASSVAKRFKIPEIIIGLTIVSMGTSMPELFVSVTSALNGSADMAIGNIIGSNICNLLLILGLSAFIRTVRFQRETRLIEIPICLAITIIFTIFCNTDGIISQIEGIILIVLFLMFIIYTISIL